MNSAKFYDTRLIYRISVVFLCIYNKLSKRESKKISHIKSHLKILTNKLNQGGERPIF